MPWNARPIWKPRHWTRLRRLVQYTALALFLVLFVASRRAGWPADLINIPMRLDPLAMLAHLLASRTLLTSSALALVTLALTLLLGRAWCGWLCPLGTLLDLFTPRRHRGKRGAPSDRWRSVKYGLLSIILAAALLANLTLLVLDPLTLLFRSLAAGFWPALDYLVSGAEEALYGLPFLRTALSRFDQWIRPDLLPLETTAYRYPWIYGGVLIGVIALGWVASRFWCRYLCPLGGLLGLLSKGGLVRRQVRGTCSQCGACARVCPTGTIDPERGYASDPGECTMCLECLGVCPEDAVAFPARFLRPEWNDYDPRRRQVLTGLGAAVVGVGLLRAGRLAQRTHPFRIRPPGAIDEELLARCIRCGECSRACPTSAIQPSVSEAGLEGMWTPVVIPRLGYCDYSCNACGQVCPVQAIPPLSLEEKRQQVIGRAYIDQNRCLPWSDGQPCIVCEEMCPVPQKAVRLETAEVVGPDGAVVTVQRPHVIRDRCIGCGICEYKCPVAGEAAIRVTAPSR